MAYHVSFGLPGASQQKRPNGPGASGLSLCSQGVGLRPHPWAKLYRSIGPVSYPEALIGTLSLNAHILLVEDPLEA